jgi:hypothetical protein
MIAHDHREAHQWWQVIAPRLEALPHAEAPRMRRED